MRVDVFLATSGCLGVHDSATAAEWHAALVSWYGAARVKQHSLQPRAAMQTQAATLSSALRALLPWAGTYRAVLIWRFDLIAPAALVGPEASPHDYLGGGGGGGRLARVGFDLAWTMPGTLVGCFHAIVSRGTAGQSDDSGPSCWLSEHSGYHGTACSGMLAAAAGLHQLPKGLGCDPREAVRRGSRARSRFEDFDGDGCPTPDRLWSPHGPMCASLRVEPELPPTLCAADRMRRDACEAVNKASWTDDRRTWDRHVAERVQGARAIARVVREARRGLGCTTGRPLVRESAPLFL